MRLWAQRRLTRHMVLTPPLLSCTSLWTSSLYAQFSHLWNGDKRILWNQMRIYTNTCLSLWLHKSKINVTGVTAINVLLLFKGSTFKLLKYFCLVTKSEVENWVKKPSRIKYLNSFKPFCSEVCGNTKKISKALKFLFRC